MYLGLWLLTDFGLDYSIPCNRLVTTSSTTLSPIYILYSSPLQTHLVFWQRIHNSLTVTSAHMKSPFHSTIPFLPSLLKHLRPPTLSLSLDSKVDVKVTTRPTVRRLVGLGVKHPFGTLDQILFLSDSWGFADVGRPSDERTVLSFTMYSMH
jgi:hypothetical protein